MANEHQKDDTQADDYQSTDNTSGAFEKFKQTISSSLLTAQGKHFLGVHFASGLSNGKENKKPKRVNLSNLSHINTNETVTKPKPSSSNDSVTTNANESFAQQQQQQQPHHHHQSQSQSNSLNSSSAQKPEPGKAPSRDGTCRVCIKSFKPGDFRKICVECQHNVCEDCASYSKVDDDDEEVNICQSND